MSNRAPKRNYRVPVTRKCPSCGRSIAATKAEGHIGICRAQRQLLLEAQVTETLDRMRAIADEAAELHRQEESAP